MVGRMMREHAVGVRLLETIRRSTVYIQLLASKYEMSAFSRLRPPKIPQVYTQVIHAIIWILAIFRRLMASAYETGLVLNPSRLVSPFDSMLLAITPCDLQKLTIYS